jgi:Response regulator containing a CheY-like receiver domain and an HTH DNA-binding domain
VNGASNKTIATTLSISEKTVKYYMTQIMQKLNAKNRVEVALTIQRDRAVLAEVR